MAFETAWRGFLSAAADPAALSGRPDHPIFALARKALDSLVGTTSSHRSHRRGVGRDHPQI